MSSQRLYFNGLIRLNFDIFLHFYTFPEFRNKLAGWGLSQHHIILQAGSFPGLRSSLTEKNSSAAGQYTTTTTTIQHGDQHPIAFWSPVAFMNAIPTWLHCQSGAKVILNPIRCFFFLHPNNKYRFTDQLSNSILIQIGSAQRKRCDACFLVWGMCVS